MFFLLLEEFEDMSEFFEWLQCLNLQFWKILYQVIE